jgi:predicted AAA+ superfamily ATPase
MTSHPAAKSMILSIRGMGKSSLGQALLRLLKSMHILYLQFFFFTMSKLAS